MKRFPVLLLAFLVTFLVSCDGGDSRSSRKSQNTLLPADEIRDILRGEEDFNYSTISTVSFSLDLKDSEGDPIDEASILVTNDKGDIVCVSKSENGNMDFNVSINKIDKSVQIKIQHKTYEERIIEIENINDYLRVDRTLFMAEKILDQKITEPGLEDEYTADGKHFIFARKSFIVAYEDNYPEVGDADFNDTVALLEMTVYTDKTMRYVNKVVVKTTVLASGAGYKQKLFLNIYGKLMLEGNYEPKLAIPLTPEVHSVLTDSKGILHTNCTNRNNWMYKYTEYYQPNPIVTEIDFNPKVCTLHFPAMPFDPYLYVEDTKQEVHLPMVETPYSGIRVYTDQSMTLENDNISFKNFPWALIFPIGEFEDQKAWRWPLETIGNGGNDPINDPYKATIFKAYPFFKDWYLSKGEQCPGWYLLPDEDEKWIYIERPW